MSLALSQLAYFESSLADMCCAQICHLHSLQSLNLSQNNLRKLPKLLAAYLRNLSSLDLSRNDFRRIPPVLASLHNLRHLSLAENPDLEVWHPLPALIQDTIATMHL